MYSIVRIDNVDFTISQSNNHDTYLVDASLGVVNAYLPYSNEITRITIKRLDEELNEIIIHPKAQERIENENRSYALKEGFARMALFSSHEGDWWMQDDSQSEGDLETIHFLQLNKLSDTVTATPGIPNPEAMSFFGQLNSNKNTMVSHCHIHRIKSGSGGQSSFEIYRLRSGQLTMIASGSTSAADGNFSRVLLQFSGTNPNNRRLAKGDYVLCQMTEKESGTARGFTVDMHFTGSR